MSSGVTSCSPSPQEQPFATIGTEALSSPSVRSLSLSSASGFRPVLTLAQHRCSSLLPQPPSYLLTRRGRPQPGSPPRVLPPRPPSQLHHSDSSETPQRVSVAQSCPTLCSPMDWSPPGSSVHRLLQARKLEWGAISFSRGSSQPRDQTQVSHIAGRFSTI